MKLTRKPSTSIIYAWYVLVGLLLWLAPVTQARPIGRRGPTHPHKPTTLLQAFRPVVNDARRSVVRLRHEGQIVARATLVTSTGLLVTKASVLGDTRPGALRAVLPNDQTIAVERVGKDRPSDLALLRTDADLPKVHLQPIRWASAPLPLGTWVASSGQQGTPLAVGIISAKSRAIAPRRVFLGIQIRSDKPGPRVEQTLVGMGAAKAGIKIGDHITHVEGKRTPTRNAVVDQLQGRLPGEQVHLKVRRDDKTLGFEVTLAPLPASKGGRSSRLNQMGGKLSHRARGFARVIQHDTVLGPNEVGTPLVDLSGKAIGLNIARAGRTATFALPASLIKKVVTRIDVR